MTGRRVLGKAVLLALVVTALVGMLGGGAAADPLPSPSATAGTNATPTPSGTPGASQTTAPAPPPVQPVDSGDAKPTSTGDKGVLGPLNVTGPDGVRLDHYDITYSTGGFMGSERPSALLGWLTDGLFSLVRILIGAVVCLLNWALAFGPATDGLKPARDLSLAYQTQVVDRLGLPAFFLTLAAAWCGFMFLRGRKSRGVAELGISLLIAALAGTLLARPADVLLGDHGLLSQTRQTSMALASITASYGRSDASDPKQVAKPLGDALIKTFVVEPHQMLNYGSVIDPTHHPKCQDAYAGIVKKGPWGTKDDPRDKMKSAGCSDLAKYNEHPSWDRFLGALLVLVAGLLIAVLVLLMVGVLLTAVAALAFYAMVAQAAFAVAVLPGGGRSALWRWVGGIVKVVLVIFAAVIFIPLLSIFIGALVRTSGDQSLIARFFLVDVVAAAGLIYHRKLVAFGTHTGNRIAERLERARYGGSRGYDWYERMGYGRSGMGMGRPGLGTTDGLSPVSARGLWHGARAEIQRVTDPITTAARAGRNTWVGPAGASAKATGRLARAGVDEDSLRYRMYKTRGGRGVWRAGKIVTGTGKAAFEYTVGLPVTLERDWQTTKRFGGKVKDKGGAAADVATDKIHDMHEYGRHWSRNVGKAADKVTGVGGGPRAVRDALRPGGQELRDKIDSARLNSSFDPATARRYLDSRAYASGGAHNRTRQATGGDPPKGTAGTAGRRTGPGTAGTTSATVTGAPRGTDPQRLAQQLRQQMEERRNRPGGGTSPPE